MVEIIAITVLSSMLVVTNLFWMRHCQKLVNKVMSRDYRDYAIGVAKEKNEPNKQKVQEVIPEDLRALQEFSFQ